MALSKFVTEHEINASKKMLYPYIASASGLAQWFADDCTIDEDKIFNFKWEDEDHKARMVAHRTNSYVKFEYFEIEDEGEHPSVEMRLEMNELTQTVFIRIIDFSDMNDDEESTELWENLIHNLKEIVGG
ncbi:START-like domain-containing protein [Bacteroidota bacterium]